MAKYRKALEQLMLANRMFKCGEAVGAQHTKWNIHHVVWVDVMVDQAPEKEYLLVMTNEGFYFL